MVVGLLDSLVGLLFDGLLGNLVRLVCPTVPRNRVGLMDAGLLERVSG